MRGPAGGADRRRRCRDRRLHRALDGLGPGRRSARVALLEAGVCGHGPSGRNGGFCESMWLSAAALRRRFGTPAHARCSMHRAPRSRRSATGAPARTWTPGLTSPATSASPRPPRSTTWAGPPSRPPRSWAPRADLRAGRRPGPQHLRRADLQARRLRARRHAAPRAPRARTAPAPDRPRRGHVRALARARAALLASANGSGGGVVADTAGGSVRAGAAVLAVGPAARSLPSCARA